jgi:hypothetical protein
VGRVWTSLPAVLALCVCPLGLSADIVTPVVADADTYIACYGYSGTDLGNQGTAPELREGGPDNFRKIYLHFDLGGLDAGLDVTAASLKVDLKANSGGGSTIVFAIMDEAKDWDLIALPESGPGSITWYSAPQNDTSGSPWQISAPDFLEEGTGTAAVTRQLGSAAVDADIDLDVTELVKWTLGQQPGYSSFADTDRQLTFCFRDVNIVNYHYTDYYSREYTPGDDGDAPRLEITQVPEPASLVLLALGAVAAVRRRRR